MSTTEPTFETPEIWDNISHDDMVSILQGVQTETAAVLMSGDVAQQRWARTTGVIATALLDLLGDASPAPSSGKAQQTQEKPSGAELDTKTTDKDKTK